MKKEEEKKQTFSWGKGRERKGIACRFVSTEEKQYQRSAKHV